MPQEMLDSMALAPWINRMGTYPALITVFCVMVGLMILPNDLLDSRLKYRRAETAMAIFVSSVFMYTSGVVDKGDDAIGEFQTWSGLQSLGHSMVSINIVITSWVLTAAAIAVALYYVHRRQAQGMQLYGFVTVSCLTLSTRAMQLYTLQDRWAVANLLLAVTSIACVALPINFAKKEWQAVTKDTVKS